jgi:hypothetical protein
LHRAWGSIASTTTAYFEVVDDENGGKKLISNSLSGGERNRIFFRRDGNYVDVSLVSGVDFREDGRSFVLFDADNDGWLDMGITSPNHPRFRVVKNVVGESECSKNANVELVLVGGNEEAKTSKQWSPRDAWGATATVTCGDEVRVFQLCCGQGLSAVNAGRIHIGMGDRKMIDRIEVRWPSGKTTIKESVPAEGRVEIRERE